MPWIKKDKVYLATKGSRGLLPLPDRHCDDCGMPLSKTLETLGEYYPSHIVAVDTVMFFNMGDTSGVRCITCAKAKMKVLELMIKYAGV